MRKLFKRVSSWILIPLTHWYLKRQRNFRYRNISLTIFPGVFHPGLFGSSKFLLQYLDEVDVSGKTFLDVGTGSGAIAIMAAKLGATVTAIDLSRLAVENTSQNARQNQVDIRVIHSDLFTNLLPVSFDFIFINPPYYPQTPGSESELAWYCGENFQYFHKLFSTLGNYMNAGTKVVMVLSQDCDLKQISQIAADSRYKLKVLKEKPVLFDEKNFLYQIQKVK